MGNSNGIPGDLDLLRSWFNVIRRARQVAQQANGVSLVTITLVCNEFGDPIEPWLSPIARRLEPTAKAETTFSQLVSYLTEVE